MNEHTSTSEKPRVAAADAGAPDPVEIARLTWPSAPPDRLRYGQPFWRVGERTFEHGEGETTTLNVYRSHCSACGKVFEVTQAPTATGGLQQRCELHREVRPSRRPRPPGLR